MLNLSMSSREKEYGKLVREPDKHSTIIITWEPLKKKVFVIQIWPTIRKLSIRDLMLHFSQMQSLEDVRETLVKKYSIANILI